MKLEVSGALIEQNTVTDANGDVQTRVIETDTDGSVRYLDGSDVEQTRTMVLPFSSPLRPADNASQES